jgi:Pentapeptide repeats (8 copies)
LEQYLLQWEAEGDTGHGMRRSPFDVTPSDRMWSPSTKDLASRPDDSAIVLTGADVLYLTARTLAGPEGDVAAAAQRVLAAQKQAALIPASRRSLSGEILRKLVYLQGANLYGAHLEGAILYGAHLEGAILYNTHLQGAFLYGARLDGARLRDADLKGTVLRSAWFDDQTNLTRAMLDDTTCLADIRWGGVGGVNLTTINWDPVPILGDEQGVGVRSDVSDHERVVRAYVILWAILHHIITAKLHHTIMAKLHRLADCLNGLSGCACKQMAFL